MEERQITNYYHIIIIGEDDKKLFETEPIELDLYSDIQKDYYKLYDQVEKNDWTYNGKKVEMMGVIQCKKVVYNEDVLGGDIVPINFTKHITRRISKAYNVMDVAFSDNIVAKYPEVKEWLQQYSIEKID